MRAVRVPLLLAVLCGAGVAADTPNISCPEGSETYKKQYESMGHSHDLVCYDKALQRELLGTQGRDCPNSAEYYKKGYESYGDAGNLACYQQARKREGR